MAQMGRLERIAMKSRTLTAVAALSLGGATLISFAQTPGQVEAQTPAPIVVEAPLEVIPDRQPETPQSDQDIRKEATNAFAEAKADCRHERGRQAQADCLKQAKDDYTAMMARVHGSKK
ncbi:hypothetical protein [Piscinibacter sp.]|jgi:hypothetical protein|uniref:hypothetical protein n=1 Tax=Piscinibacter sp. TaxID=1903157 RepID=UPI002F42BD64